MGILQHVAERLRRPPAPGIVIAARLAARAPAEPSARTLPMTTATARHDPAGWSVARPMPSIGHKRAGESHAGVMGESWYVEELYMGETWTALGIWFRGASYRLILLPRQTCIVLTNAAGDEIARRTMAPAESVALGPNSNDVVRMMLAHVGN